MDTCFDGEEWSIKRSEALDAGSIYVLIVVLHTSPSWRLF